MVRLIGVHATQDAQVVGMARDFGEQFGDPLAALAVLSEAPRRAEQPRAGQPGAREGLAVVGLQARLVVEGVNVRGAAFHAEKNDSLGAGWEVRGAGGEGGGEIVGSPRGEARKGEVAK